MRVLHTSGHAQYQTLLLPALLEDYVAANNPVQFIDAFVDELDLGSAGFQRTQPKATGLPGYDPATDAYHCPGGQVLDTRHSSVTCGHVMVQYSSPVACAGCQMKAPCTTGRWRPMNRWEKEEIIERMA